MIQAVKGRGMRLGEKDQCRVTGHYNLKKHCLFSNIAVTMQCKGQEAPNPLGDELSPLALIPAQIFH